MRRRARAASRKTKGEEDSIGTRPRAADRRDERNRERLKHFYFRSLPGCAAGRGDDDLL